jgi:peptidyl-prolyl cis-trans isomerase SurA
MSNWIVTLRRTFLATVMGVSTLTFVMPVAPVLAASQIQAVVNSVPVTSGDVSRRVNLLRLQHAPGNIQKLAIDQLVDEVLKRQEILRLKASVSTEEVDAAFGRFAQSNKLTASQLADILQKAGVGADHFKAFIAVSMSWPRVVAARFGGGSDGKKSTQDIMVEMQQSGKKLQTTEYFLQQVIFVIPESKRGKITAKRKSEAEASRAKFPGCDQARAFAATMRDVSIRDLGRILKPQLPEDWKPLIEKAKDGGTTGTRETERGIEYLVICKQREVNDDVAAETVFRAEDLAKSGDSEDPNSKKYIEELRSKALISLK